MTTINQSILPIPENVVVGSGGYTVPANKYAYFCGNVSINSVGWIGTTSNPEQLSRQQQAYFQRDGCALNNGNTALTNKHTQTLVAGDTLTVSSNTATKAQVGVSTQQTHFASTGQYHSTISINAVPVCVAKCSGSIFFTSNTTNNTPDWGISGISQIGWSVAEFPIPKNNLPNELIEGN